MKKQNYIITDLTEKDVPLYCVCLEDWSSEMKDAGDHKAKWYNIMKNKGLRVKLAKNQNGETGGMIQYFPSQYANIEAKDMYFIHCIWVHGYKKGRGNFQKKGMGTALINAAVEDVKALGVSGIIAWGLSLPFWMKASWFKKHGFKTADKMDMMELLWKKFKDSAETPKWINLKKNPLETQNNKKIIITGFINGVCPSGGINFERAKKAASSFKDTVEFREINTREPAVIQEWGITDAVYINNKCITAGPPLTYDKIVKLIKKEVKKLKK